ncbi:MAG: ATP-binding protein [Saprospiraceae bacterium]
MKKETFIFVYILFGLCISCFAQSSTLFGDSFTESTSEQEKFNIYLDSINKYLYRDFAIASSAIDECERIIANRTELTDSSKIAYQFAKIYLAHSNQEPLEAYREIVKLKPYFNSGKGTAKQRSSYFYLKGFTYMAIGDFESAQNTYYENIKYGKLTQDTSLIIKNYYSLGQLLEDERKYESAIECYKTIKDKYKDFKVRPSTEALFDLELTEVYLQSGNYEPALKLIKERMPFMKKHNLSVLKIDFLQKEGKIYLKQGKIKAAEKVYALLAAVDQSFKDGHNFIYTETFVAELQLAKRQYREARKTYENLLNYVDSTEIDLQLSIYKALPKVCKQMKDFIAAYDYLERYTQLKAKLDEDEKRQKTAYLQIKFDTKQKENDNKLLAAKIVKNQTEKKFLIMLSALFGLFLVILFWAFYQKKQYNQRLKQEVKRRTIKLEESNQELSEINQELDEFNRILSHDLKEPLRSIVSFSQLAIKEVNHPARVIEHLYFVQKGGVQLNQLIRDVSIFRAASKVVPKNYSFTQISPILNDILHSTREKYPEKLIELKSNFIPEIMTQPKILHHIIENLLDNAVKYNTELVVNIHFQYEMKEDTHTFLLTDNGIGVAKEYHESIFAMFKRLNDRSKYVGSGLGLSIAQKLCRKLNGEVTLIRSQPNVGSTFKIVLPIMQVPELV